MVPVPPDGDRSNLQRRILIGVSWVGSAMVLGSWLLEDAGSSGSATTLRLLGLGAIFVVCIAGWRKIRQWTRNARDTGLSRREARRSRGLSAGYWVTMCVCLSIFNYLTISVTYSPSDVGRIVIAVAVITVSGVVMGARLEIVGAAARTRQGLTLGEWWTSKAGIGTTLVLSFGAIIAALTALLTWPERPGVRIVAMSVVAIAGCGAGATITRLRSSFADKPVASAPVGSSD
ncbi:MAG: hypothetical protein OXB99_02825 [Acidimicrobiaceae bacterium]|nr:hypothetical protein [Acidimicrobiaceae bacterium]